MASHKDYSLYHSELRPFTFRVAIYFGSLGWLKSSETIGQYCLRERRKQELDSLFGLDYL